jgi:hypothetical protein
MAVKYSGRLEDSAKLGETVVLWENAEKVVERYNHVYTEMKNAIKAERAGRSAISRLERFKADLQASEEAVMEIAHRLRVQYDDEFVIRKRSATDFIEGRRARLDVLMRQQGFGTDSPVSVAARPLSAVLK